jgi:hypothetical protein
MLQGMTIGIGVSNPQQLQEFWQSIRENELAIGAINAHMIAIQANQSQHNQAGAEAYWGLFHQLKPYSEKIEAAYRKLNEPPSQ